MLYFSQSMFESELHTVTDAHAAFRDSLESPDLNFVLGLSNIAVGVLFWRTFPVFCFVSPACAGGTRHKRSVTWSTHTHTHSHMDIFLATLVTDDSWQ